MSKIVRTPTRATGGITPAEKAAMADYADLWIKRAMRTAPIEPDKIVPAIEAIYAAAGLKRPRVVIVPSPIVMAFAYGASAAIWYKRAATDDATGAATSLATHDATYDATGAATSLATRAATDVATRGGIYDAIYVVIRAAIRAATDDATYVATGAAVGTDAAETLTELRAATYVAIDVAIRAATDDATACFDLAGEFGLRCAALWWRAYQGGNMWAAWPGYLGACRDILGLRLPEHEKYAAWEQAAIHGGFRVMHPEFCIVSDFPERLLIDEQHRPHCEDGPSHRWRDGWSLYHWHGVRVPAEWIEQRATIDPSEIIRHENAEVRRAGTEIIGWARIAEALGARVIEADPDPEIGEVIEMDLPDLGPRRFLRMRCATGRTFVEGIDPAMPTPAGFSLPVCAHAHRYRLHPAEWHKPHFSA